jgi:flagellar hook-basal body complex protein FliE
MYSSLQITKIDADMLPSEGTRTNLVELMVRAQTEQKVSTIRAFLDQLKTMLDKLVKAQEKHRQIHGEMMKQCLNEDKFRQKEVADAKDALSRATGAFEKCKKSLEENKLSLPLLKEEHKSYVKLLAEKTKLRREQNKSYLERKADYSEAIGFLSNFIAYVNKKLAGSFKAYSFVQFSEKLLQHSSKLGFMGNAVPALVAIAEATYSAAPKANDYEFKANEAVGAKLKRVLSELLAKLEADNKENDEEEAKRAKIYAVLKAKLTKIINTLARAIKKVEKQIKDMQRCMTTEKKIMKTASSKLSRNDTLRQNAAKMCVSFNKEFIQATLDRLDEIKTMNEILVIVTKRFKDLPKSIIGYLESVADGWKQYVNSTEFQKFVAYQKKQFLVNKRGQELMKAKNHVTEDN